MTCGHCKTTRVSRDHVRACSRPAQPGETCRRCAGKGHLPGYEHVLGGICFGCWGTCVTLTPDEAARYAEAARAFA